MSKSSENGKAYRRRENGDDTYTLYRAKNYSRIIRVKATDRFYSYTSVCSRVISVSSPPYPKLVHLPRGRRFAPLPSLVIPVHHPRNAEFYLSLGFSKAPRRQRNRFIICRVLRFSRIFAFAIERRVSCRHVWGEKIGCGAFLTSRTTFLLWWTHQ